MGKHVAQRRLRIFEVRGSKEEGGEFRQSPPFVDGVFVEIGVWKMMSSPLFGGGAGSKEGGRDWGAASQRKVGKFEGGSGDSGDILPG